MPSFADERLALSIEQHALLWAFRLWIAEHTTSADMIRRIGSVVSRLGAPDLAGPLVRFMLVIARGATRQIGVNYLCQAEISGDEHALLDILSMAQNDRSFEALLLLRCLVTREEAQAGLCCAERCGEALARAGRRLPPPRIDMRHLAFVRSPEPVGNHRLQAFRRN